MIYQNIKDDMLKAVKEKFNTNKLQTLRLLIGEIERDPNKDYSDEKAISIIRKMIVNDKETIELRYKNGTLSKAESVKSTAFQYTLSQYLPKQVSKEDLIIWISQNINFNDYKNPLQAIKPVKEHFGTTVDGNVVKDVITEMCK